MAQDEKEHKLRPVPPPTSEPEPIHVDVKPSPLQTITAFGSLLAALGTLALVAGLLYQVHVAKDEFVDFKKQRRTDRMEERYLEFYSSRMVFARSRAADEYPSLGLNTLRVFEFFERLARDHQHGVVAPEDVVFTFEDALLLYWCGWQEEVRNQRIEEGEDPDTGEPWQGFQKLVQAVQQQEQISCKSQVEIEDLIKYERNRFRAEVDFNAAIQGGPIELDTQSRQASP